LGGKLPPDPRARGVTLLLPCHGLGDEQLTLADPAIQALTAQGVVQSRVALFGFRGGRLGSLYQSRNESAEQGFAAASRVVHELKEPEIKRQLVL